MLRLAHSQATRTLSRGSVAPSRSLNATAARLNGEVIGIDLGTTNSCVAVSEGRTPRVIENAEGARTTPSVVGFREDGERLVGVAAKRESVTNPTNTIYGAKRLIGRKFGDAETNSLAKLVPYDVVKADNNSDAWVVAQGKKYSPSQIGSFVLGKMKETAEGFLGHEVKDAVVTVPAYFNDAQRQATKDAGFLAGLNVQRIINEPTAAALAYGMDKADGSCVAVFDLGGGTFDVSILEIADGVFEVKATNGDTMLGGEDFDEELLKYLVAEFQKTSGIDLSSDKLAMQRLREEAEKAKRELDGLSATEVNLPFISMSPSTGPVHLNIRVTRSQFEQLVDPLVQRTLEPCRKCMADADMTTADVNDVILVGGQSRMPAVQTAVENFFGKAPSRSVNPDEVVAMGAAIQGGVLRGDITDLLLLDVTPLSLGIETYGGLFTRLINRNTTVPTKKTNNFSTAADNQPMVEVKVLQGEREMAADNKMLGRFELADIPPAPRGVPQIEVAFDIDADGIVKVSAKDQATNNLKSIEIRSGGGLTDDEIQRMLDEAESHAAADQERKETIETRNECDSLIYSTEKSAGEHKDALDSAVQGELERAVAELKTAMEGDDLEALKAKKAELEQVAMKIGQAVYKSQGGEGGSEDAAAADDNVVDAEFKEKKE